MNNLKVSHVRISNILGIEELEFSPEGFTEISGGNGKGKTSVLEAIKAAVSGGHDATLLRNGAGKGEIVLVLDDGSEIKKRVTEKGTYVDVVKDGMKAQKPAETIKAIADLLSVNPIEFLRAPEKDRVNVLMESMPIKVDRKRLPVDVAGIDGLDLIEASRKTVYDERTGLNRAIKEKEATISQLRQTLPDSEPDAQDDAVLQQNIATVDAEKDRKFAAIQGKMDRLQGEHDAKVQGLRTEIEGINATRDAKINGLREQIAKLQEQISTETNAAVSQVSEVQQQIAAAETELGENRTKASNARQAAITDHATKRAVFTNQLAAIEEAKKAATKAETTRATIKQLEDQLAGLQKEAEMATAGLDALETYKTELLATLPIPGLEVRGGKVYRNNVSFDRLNTAQQVEIAIEIAKLRASDLRLVCVDGLELLDPAAFEAFKSQAAKSGLQLIVSRVGSGPLTINRKAA